jgi:hypothetical protein
MITFDREAIYAALFNLVDANKASIGLQTASRRLQHIQDVDASNMPAFFQTQVDEGVVQMPNTPPKFTLFLEWWLYISHAPPGDTTAPAPSTIFNPIVDKLQQALNLPPGNGIAPQTLGGLVQAVTMSGKIKYADGSLDTQSIVMLPLAVIVV